MERLDVSHNQLTRVPVGVFSSASGRSLCELDLSGNLIAALQPIDVVHRFKVVLFMKIIYFFILVINFLTFNFCLLMSSNAI